MNALALVLRQAVAIRSLPRHMVAITAVAAGVAGGIAALEGWPLWAIGACVVAPTLPLLTCETAWLYRHYGWFFLFWVLVVTQVGHFVEHIAQMIQIHLVGQTAKEAHGIFGQLDIEWVHFIWNSWVVLAAAWLLAIRFWRNPWLWATVVIATWHAAEHVVVFRAYLETGRAGDPGLLAKGGRIGGGLPILRPDLHFFYNFVETVPLVIAFMWQVRRTFIEPRSREAAPLEADFAAGEAAAPVI